MILSRVECSFVHTNGVRMMALAQAERFENAPTIGRTLRR